MDGVDFAGVDPFEKSNNRVVCLVDDSFKVFVFTVILDVGDAQLWSLIAEGEG